MWMEGVFAGQRKGRDRKKNRSPKRQSIFTVRHKVSAGRESASEGRTVHSITLRPPGTIL